MTTPRTSPRKAFTLIEILTVVTITMILASLLTPIMVLAQKRAAITNTRSIMAKAETALVLFDGELATWPYQAHDPADPFPADDNRLGWFLAHRLDAGERSAIAQDLATVRAAYGPGGSQQFEEADVESRVSSRHHDSHAAMLNRMAIERATLAVLAGHTAIEGVHAHAGDPLLPNPVSDGFAFDFLSPDLNPEDLRGDTLLDAWGRPLIYNCPVVRGTRPFTPTYQQAGGGNAVAGGGQSVLVPELYGLQTTGRQPTLELASDQRTTAHPDFRHRFELWSAGPDGLIHPQRDHPVNRDNIPAGEYEEGLR